MEDTNSIERMYSTERMDSIERMTQQLLVQSTGLLLAKGWSDHAIIKSCEEISRDYHLRMLGRYDDLNKDQ